MACFLNLLTGSLLCRATPDRLACPFFMSPGDHWGGPSEHADPGVHPGGRPSCVRSSPPALSPRGRGHTDTHPGAQDGVGEHRGRALPGEGLQGPPSPPRQAPLRGGRSRMLLV